MSTAAPQKRFTTLRRAQNASCLLCGLLIFLFWITSASCQEPPRLFISKDFPTERPAPQLAPSGQLTPSGQMSVERPLTIREPFVTTPLEVLPPAQKLLKPPVLPTIKREDLDLVIQEGQALEAGAHWSEALAHYESALRAFQNHADLMDHYRVARYHCDVGRRIHDPSYLNLIKTLSAVETLHFFEEVITQIQREYADTPRWEPLFQYGIQSFSIALADPNFRTKVNLKASPEQINAYLSAVQTTVGGWKIRDRNDMKNGLLHIAEGAQKQLGLDPSVTIMEFTCGVVNSLDPNTTYLSPNQLNDQFSTIYGNLVGLGVELRSDRESLVITRIIQGSPAEENGLKVNDRILAVDGTSTRGRDTDSAAELLQGKEGTTVKLSILSAGLGQRQRDVTITRRKIDVPSVEDVRMINNQLGYLKLTNFQSKTCLELTKALNELNGRGMQCLVLDLRQNPGGLFESGIAVASMFIEKGAIVRTQGRDRSMDAPSMAKGETWHVPLIVLIDEESASAAEIVAGAIRDHDRGILIGKRTYGKGTIQKIIPIQVGSSRSVRSGIKLTAEKFYSPQGWAYSGVGVTPHFTIEEEKQTTLMRPLGGRLQLLRPVTSNLDDPFIQKAVEVAKDHAKSAR
jgi:carboxyl-terminal processing protease